MTKRKKKAKTCYLAGPMEFAHNEGINWRRAYEKAFAEIGIKCIIPNDEEKDIKREHDLSYLKKNDLDEYKRIIRQFMVMDIKFVEEADIIVTRWEGEQTAGTIHEAGHAYMIGKPTYLVTSIKPVDIPGWFLASFHEIFTSMKDLVQHIKQHHI